MGVSIALVRGDRGEIIKWMEREAKDDPVLSLVNPVLIDMLDDHDAALRYLTENFEHPRKSYDWLSMWAAYHGDPELALRANRRTEGGFMWGPLYSEMRKLPEFKEVVRDAGLVDYWREFGWGYYCRPLGADEFTCD